MNSLLASQVHHRTMQHSQEVLEEQLSERFTFSPRICKSGSSMSHASASPATRKDLVERLYREVRVVFLIRNISFLVFFHSSHSLVLFSVLLRLPSCPSRFPIITSSHTDELNSENFCAFFVKKKR